MKKYFKLYCLLVIFALSANLVLAQTPPLPGGGWDDNGDEDENQGDGTQKTPIDNYLPILIITAVTIAGIYSYKERKLIQK